jgi:hypothetical protein
MSTTSATEANPRLMALSDAGVSVWLDQISRELVGGGGGGTRGWWRKKATPA